MGDPRGAKPPVDLTLSTKRQQELPFSCTQKEAAVHIPELGGPLSIPADSIPRPCRPHPPLQETPEQFVATSPTVPEPGGPPPGQIQPLNRSGDARSAGVDTAAEPAAWSTFRWRSSASGRRGFGHVARVGCSWSPSSRRHRHGSSVRLRNHRKEAGQEPPPRPGPGPQTDVGARTSHRAVTATPGCMRSGVDASWPASGVCINPAAGDAGVNLGAA